MNTRRVVVGSDENGRTAILSDGPAPTHHEFVSIPGQAITHVWRTPGPATDTPPAEEPTELTGPRLPGPGGVSCIVMQLAPESVMRSPEFDGAAAGPEFFTYASDIASASDPDYPQLHRHRTLDMAVVLEGEVYLEVDDGKEVLLKVGDTIVQIVSRHAWHNRSSEPVRLMTTSVSITGD